MDHFLKIKKKGYKSLKKKKILNKLEKQNELSNACFYLYDLWKLWRFSLANCFLKTLPQQETFFYKKSTGKSVSDKVLMYTEVDKPN